MARFGFKPIMQELRWRQVFGTVAPQLLRENPEFNQLLKDLGATVID